VQNLTATSGRRSPCDQSCGGVVLQRSTSAALCRHSGRLVHHQKFCALGCVVRMTKIPDVDELIAGPLQQDEVDRLSRRIAHEHSRALIHTSRNEMPIVDSRIVGEVVFELSAATPPGLVDEFELHLVRQHGADGVEIARVKPVDVRGKTQALRLRIPEEEDRQAPGRSRASAHDHGTGPP
jgi:hypothetical protein